MIQTALIQLLSGLCDAFTNLSDKIKENNFIVHGPREMTFHFVNRKMDHTFFFPFLNIYTLGVFLFFSFFFFAKFMNVFTF